jgi:hypothetical protein
VDQNSASWNHLVPWLRLLAKIDGHSGLAGMTQTRLRATC